MIWILPASFALVAIAARTVSVEEKTNPSTVHTLMGNSGMGSRKYLSSYFFFAFFLANETRT